MSEFTVEFQPYTLTMIDTQGPSGYASRQLITFPTLRRKCRFMLFLRRKCHGKRRGNWSCIPGSVSFGRATEYALRHGCYVYDILVKKVPIHGHRNPGSSDSDDDSDDSEDDGVAEEEILSGDENL